MQSIESVNGAEDSFGLLTKLLLLSARLQSCLIQKTDQKGDSLICLELASIVTDLCSGLPQNKIGRDGIRTHDLGLMRPATFHSSTRRQKPALQSTRREGSPAFFCSAGKRTQRCLRTNRRRATLERWPLLVQHHVNAESPGLFERSASVASGSSTSLRDSASGKQRQPADPLPDQRAVICFWSCPPI